MILNGIIFQFSGMNFAVIGNGVDRFRLNFTVIFCVFCLMILQLKELEKSGPKKGVISQSVKDVIQSLVDDDLVFKDKIGTSVSRCLGVYPSGSYFVEENCKCLFIFGSS